MIPSLLHEGKTEQSKGPTVRRPLAHDHEQIPLVAEPGPDLQDQDWLPHQRSNSGHLSESAMKEIARYL